MRIRPDVWKLDPWDPTIEWYARAIAEMRTRSLDDPSGWRFQAAIHAYNRSGDPYAAPGDTLPSSGDQQRFWNQCQHSSWYFLPWHRMYLGHFEAIVAQTVEQLGGPSGWSLPYWNYSDDSNPDARRIPPAFREPTLPDGTTPNPLRVSQRVAAANSGGIVADPAEVDIVDALDETVFVGTAFGGTTGFGGPQTAFNHGGGPPGKLEMTPHGDVHVAVGGSFPPGFMSRFNTAGLDPLFWLHHANIDRMWSVWLARAPGNANPSENAWKQSPTFEFHDAAGQVVGMTSEEVVDSTSSPFFYRYEDESDPLATPAPSAAVAAAAAAAGEEVEMTQEPAEMVAASDEKTRLRGRAVTTRVAVESPIRTRRAPRGAAAAAPGPPQRIHLNLENIRGTHPVPHRVYIDLPEGADPDDHPERLAGTVSMFGLAEASGEDQEHPGSGLQYALDITRLVEALGEEWDPEELRVTLVPKQRPAEAPPGAEAAAAPAAEAAEHPTIEIGRISVYRTP
ncbi:MAG: tyrosinase family protein [Acidobacteria bacterium]|nr:MAG: tyrosinase family protein [Acidobacteriota bacterium]REK04247.1 MAG: tyrosinase family protein [Acidobacteriota bacterium]